MVIMENVGSLEQKAIERKERLKNLKRKTSSDAETENNQDKLCLPKPKFRSYKPLDENLQEAKVDDAQPTNVEEEVKDLIDAGKEKVVLDNLDITSLAPRKPDWDLKRDVAKKLEKLERRTQKSIAELIWDRLKQDSNSDLSAMVNISRPLNEE